MVSTEVSFLAAHNTNKTGHSVASWIFWESGTIKRVCRSSSASEVLSAVEGYDATMWLLALWKEISGQDLDALLVTDSESLQQKAVSTALPTEKWLRIDMALLGQGLRRGEYGLVWAGSSSNLANSLTKGPRGISPTMSVKLPLLRALDTNCTHLDTVPTRIKTWADVSKYKLYSLEEITPLDNCLCRDRRQPATASYLDSTLASLLVRKEGKCCYVLTTRPRDEMVFFQKKTPSNLHSYCSALHRVSTM
jgi:hypothetical protein